MADEYLEMQKLLNQYNLESANKQMAFQDYMSSTAHQREVTDLIKAGLNPVLSANNGAAALPGAYAGVDSAPISAKLAEKQLKMQLANAFDMNKYSTDVGYQLGIAQAGISAGATVAAANAAAAASKYGADQSYAASVYNANKSFENAEAQRAWDSMHPTNAYQATGSALEFLGNVFGNTASKGASYGPGGSSAK